MKFGGASVSSPGDFVNVANIILNRFCKFDNIVVVVSAMQNTTDYLIDLAQQINSQAPQRERDMLISAGERISISLLAMALAKKGAQAISFTGSQSGIITTSEHSCARIIDVRPVRLLELMNQKKIIIVAGFQGVSSEKEITTLGRGGSDTSAVALGVALDADCVEFYKDVDGVFDEDPKQSTSAQFQRHLSYDQLLAIIDEKKPILHPRCVELAKKNGLRLYVKSFLNPQNEGTSIFDEDVLRSSSKYYESQNQF